MVCRMLSIGAPVSPKICLIFAAAYNHRSHQNQQFSHDRAMSLQRFFPFCDQALMKCQHHGIRVHCGIVRHIEATAQLLRPAATDPTAADTGVRFPQNRQCLRMMRKTPDTPPSPSIRVCRDLWLPSSYFFDYQRTRRKHTLHHKANFCQHSRRNIPPFSCFPRFLVSPVLMF